MTAIMMMKVEACLAELERLLIEQTQLSTLTEGSHDPMLTHVANQRDRLLLWAHDVSIWTGQLDETLRGSSKLHEHISRLLSDMLEELTLANAPLPDDTLEEISDIINNLVRMEGALNTPAKTSAEPLSTNITTVSRASSIVPNPGNMQTKPIESHQRPPMFKVVALKSRFGSTKPDVDVIAVSNPGRLRSWTSHVDRSNMWLNTMLPQILEENGVYPRVISVEYGISHPSSTSQVFEYTSLSSIADHLVQQLNTFRARDPKRPLFFFSHGLGGIVSKQAIIRLIQEGVSVSSDRIPVSGCLFFSVPLCPPEAKFFLRRWLRSTLSTNGIAQTPGSATHLDTLAKDVLRINEAFHRHNEAYKMPHMYCFEDSPSISEESQAMYVPKQYSSTTDSCATNTEFLTAHTSLASFTEDDRDQLLPLIHFCAGVVQKAIHAEEVPASIDATPTSTKENHIAKREDLRSPRDQDLPLLSLSPFTQTAEQSPSASSSHHEGTDDKASTEPNRAQMPFGGFKCDFCPLRFTRASNLQSHLRTHTFQRPFVCTTCGKDFWRQQDRKRHEILHTRYKGFVCGGTLPSARSAFWGCGRRFARVDALARHFRSEAGRDCIDPLIAEEHGEQDATQAGDKIDRHGQQDISGQSAANPMEASQSEHLQLPAALLQQYPALADIWSSSADWQGDSKSDDIQEASETTPSFDADYDEPWVPEGSQFSFAAH